MMDKSMLEEIYFHPKITLLEISLIRTITTLCKDRELCSLILQCDFQLNLSFRFGFRKEKAWKTVEEKANELISKLFIPISLEKKVLDLLWPVCIRIRMWNLIYTPSIEHNFVQHFYWTNRGRVDSIRTARHILGNTNISVTKRFALASKVCLSEEIGEMWKKMSDADKAYVGNIEKVSPLVVYWAKAMEKTSNDFTHPIGLLQYALDFAVGSGLVHAIKFIFAQLTEDAKKIKKNNYFARLYANSKSIPKYFGENYNEMIYFFFFEMTDDRQQFVFKEGTHFVFALLLQASKYELCRSLIQERIQNLSNIDISEVLKITLCYHLEFSEGVDCTQLFYDVWRITPSVTKSYLASTDFGAMYPAVLIKYLFPFVLEEETVQEIAELTSSGLKYSTSDKQFEFDQGKLKILHFFIDEEITTIPVLESYKADILICLEKDPSDNVAWNRILRFVSCVASKNSQRKESKD